MFFQEWPSSHFVPCLNIKEEPSFVWPSHKSSVWLQKHRNAVSQQEWPWFCAAGLPPYHWGIWGSFRKHRSSRLLWKDLCSEDLDLSAVSEEEEEAGMSTALTLMETFVGDKLADGRRQQKSATLGSLQFKWGSHLVVLFPTKPALPNMFILPQTHTENALPLRLHSPWCYSRLYSGRKPWYITELVLEKPKTGHREAKFLDIENIFHLTQAITLSGPYAKPMKCFLLWEMPAGWKFPLLSFRTFCSWLLQGLPHFKVCIMRDITCYLQHWGETKSCVFHLKTTKILHRNAAGR